MSRVKSVFMQPLHVLMSRDGSFLRHVRLGLFFFAIVHNMDRDISHVMDVIIDRS